MHKQVAKIIDYDNNVQNSELWQSKLLMIKVSKEVELLNMFAKSF